MDSCTFFLPSTLLTERAEREVGTTTQHTPEDLLLAEQCRQHFQKVKRRLCNLVTILQQVTSCALCVLQMNSCREASIIIYLL